MSRDGDLERDLEQLMSHVDLPARERWIPEFRERHRSWSALTVGAVATALLLALTVGVVSVAAPSATRRPLTTSLPNVVRPTRSVDQAPTAPPSPRATATTRAVPGPIAVPAPTDEAFAFAGDDAALAYIGRSADGAATLHVVDLASMTLHDVAITRGRGVSMVRGGALRGDLVTYTETEAKDVSAPTAVVVWHVMVANWRTGLSTELDAIPGEIQPDPDSNNYAPNPYTDGRGVVWLRTPVIHGTPGDSEVVLWRGGATRVIYRGHVTYAIADDGRIAIAQLECAPASALRTCPSGTRWELRLLEADFTPRIVATRDVAGWPPAFADTRIVWPRLPGGPRNVTSVDVVDLATGTTRNITKADCSFVGSTVRELVFSCAGHAELVDIASGAETSTPGYVIAGEPHAIIGREAGTGNPPYTVTPVR